MWATKSWKLWSFREKQRFCWQKNILLSFSKAFMFYDPNIVIIELSLSYLSRCGPLRAGICGVSGKTKVLLAEKYSLVLQQTSHVIWSQICYSRIEFEFELLIKM
jgi:hypothetical protein